MTETKAGTHLLHLVDSDSEDDLGVSTHSTQPFPSINASLNSSQVIRSIAMPPVKKGKVGRPPANRVTKPVSKPTTSGHRSSDRVAAAIDESTLDEKEASAAKLSNTSSAPEKRGPGRPPKQKRIVTAEKEEIEDSVMMDAPVPTPDAAPKRGRGRPKKNAVDPLEPDAPGARRKGKIATKGPELDITQAAEVSEIPETQLKEETDDATGDREDNEQGLDEDSTQITPRQARACRRKAAAQASVSKQSPAKSPEKGDSALHKELAEMRRKYEDMKRQYEDVKSKYDDIRETGVEDANHNFIKFKKQAEEKSKVAQQLIAALQAQLAEHKEAAKEAISLRAQIEEQESMITSLQSKIDSLTSSLAEARSEIKSLNLKLAAARNAEAAANAAAAAGRQIPGSAIKGANSREARLAAAATSEAIQQATMAAQKKEDLYGDLTGLIVRSVKREDGEDKFDCIQTGRNGTLHFKLAIDADQESGADAQCHYMPQLDPNRDRALIAVLPEFLTDEISFPQSQAGKFYARVLKALNETPAPS